MEREIVKLYLEKRDKMSEVERQVILDAIELMNKPIFSSSFNGSDITNIIYPNGGTIDLSQTPHT